MQTRGVDRTAVAGMSRIALVWTLAVVCGCSTEPRATVELPPPVSRPSPAEDHTEVVALAPTPRSVIAIEGPAPAVPHSAPVEPPPGAPLAASATAPATAPVVAAPSEAGGAASAPRERVRIDAMVGQINGRPLFASDFFQSMDARLRAEAKRRTPEDWLRFARTEIRKALRDRIRDELLLAEVESSLTPAQRAGLVTFVRSLRENLISENRGSEELADRKMLESQGITLAEAVEARKNEELIRSWLRRILQNKVYVPWRDVTQRYERDRDLYNPPATAILRMIRAPATDTERIAAVNDALAAGDDFTELARERSTYSPDTGGLLERVLDEPYKQAALIGVPELNDAAHTLTPGQVTGPIEVGKNVYWLKLDEIRSVSRSLYEVQMQIQQQLFSERVQKAEEAYFSKLLDRSGLGTGSEIDRMEKRLFEIAAERYLLSKQD